ncbi:hypothetical protein EYF80_042088 [Liparis tanakae]|uniref:Uncharacterized protein n=1 Tax=Liparis tanakae TaxID=230148 RepID=A0A4Z2G335_9TELE|nr:hypothetical protein EYF80_042088 [Liparis tanakae]
MRSRRGRVAGAQPPRCKCSRLQYDSEVDRLSLRRGEGRGGKNTGLSYFELFLLSDRWTRRLLAPLGSSLLFPRSCFLSRARCFPPAAGMEDGL